MKRLCVFVIALFCTLTASAAGSAINRVTLDGNAVTVNVTAETDCALWGAVYAENGAMLAAHSADVSGAASAQTVTLSFSDGIPANGYAKAFLLDAKTFLPLTLPGDTRNGDVPAYTQDVYAILYADGALVFQHGDRPQSGREVKKTYEVEMAGSYQWAAPWHDEADSIERVEFADRIRPKSTAFWFYRCAKLKEISGLPYLDTADAISMNGMFNGCSSLTALDVSAFDTANVTTMRNMFSDCSSLKTLDLSAFNTANVTDMSVMFGYWSSLTALDVSSFNTANVTDMREMFGGCVSLAALDVSSFNTANVTDMSYMFCACESLTELDVSAFDTANVATMGRMFKNCSSLSTLDLSGFDASGVTDIKWMFYSCDNLTAIYASERFVTNQVTEGDEVFLHCASLVGGAGTAYDETRTDKDYARIDGGASAPGYFTAKS